MLAHRRTYGQSRPRVGRFYHAARGIVNAGIQHRLASETPIYVTIVGYGAAYWLWLTSLALVIVSGANRTGETEIGGLLTHIARLRKRFAVHANEKLIVFVELESAMATCADFT